MAKSYWQSVSTDGLRSQRAIKSWFAPMCDDMLVLKAETLCDIETDKEKKIRALVQDERGRQRWAIRTFGRKYTVTLKSVIKG